MDPTVLGGKMAVSVYQYRMYINYDEKIKKIKKNIIRYDTVYSKIKNDKLLLFYDLQ